MFVWQFRSNFWGNLNVNLIIKTTKYEIEQEKLNC